MSKDLLFKVVLKTDHINSYGFIFDEGWVGYTHLAYSSHFYIPIGMDEGFPVKRESCKWEEVPYFEYLNSIPDNRE